MLTMIKMDKERTTVHVTQYKRNDISLAHETVALIKVLLHTVWQIKIPVTMKPGF